MLQTLIVSRLFVVALASPASTNPLRRRIDFRLKQAGLNVIHLENITIGHDASCNSVSVDDRLLVVDVYRGTREYLAKLWGPDADGGQLSIQKLERDAQVFNQFYFEGPCFSIASDSLRIKPLHVYETDNYTALASRIGDLRNVLGVKLSEPDHVGLAELFYFRTPLEQRTLHKNIRRRGTGDATWWSRTGGLKMKKGVPIILPEPDPAMALGELATRINDTFISSVSRRQDRSGGANAVALSGGFDSRLIAAALKGSRVNLRAYCYGEEHHREVTTAKRVAKELGLDIERIPYRADDYTRYLPHHIRCMEGQCDTRSTQICHLLEIDCENGSTLFHGFLGDAIQGHHLIWLDDGSYGSFEALTEGLFSYHHTEEVGRLVQEMGLGIRDDDIRQSIWQSLPRTEKPYRALMLWNLIYRQRRYIGSHFALLGEKFRVVAPYYDPGVMAAWAVAPRIALDDRYLVRRVLEKYYPAMARIVHAQEVRPITPSVMVELSNFVREKAVVFSRTNTMAKLGKKLGRRWRRRKNIWILASGASTKKDRTLRLESIRRNEKHLRSELSLDVSKSLLEDYLAKRKWETEHRVALRMLSGLCEYAASLSAEKPTNGT